MITPSPQRLFAAAAFLAVFHAATVRAQQPFDSSAWDISATESRVESYRGRNSLLLREGAAWLKNYLKGKVSLLRGEDVLPCYHGRRGPHIGRVLDAAWEAQLRSEFKDREGALRWMEKYVKDGEVCEG